MSVYQTESSHFLSEPARLGERGPKLHDEQDFISPERAQRVWGSVELASLGLDRDDISAIAAAKIGVAEGEAKDLFRDRHAHNLIFCARPKPEEQMVEFQTICQRRKCGMFAQRSSVAGCDVLPHGFEHRAAIQNPGPDAVFTILPMRLEKPMSTSDSSARAASPEIMPTTMLKISVRDQRLPRNFASVGRAPVGVRREEAIISIPSDLYPVKTVVSSFEHSLSGLATT